MVEVFQELVRRQAGRGEITDGVVQQADHGPGMWAGAHNAAHGQTHAILRQRDDVDPVACGR
nr:hypothetical protein [Streptomyces sp. S1D4-11]QIY92888.1 hypothetical protein HEP87_02550 [Streptomyces sp. S1D4-11]